MTKSNQDSRVYSAAFPIEQNDLSTRNLYVYNQTSKVNVRNHDPIVVSVGLGLFMSRPTLSYRSFGRALVATVTLVAHASTSRLTMLLEALESNTDSLQLHTLHVTKGLCHLVPDALTNPTCSWNVFTSEYRSQISLVPTLTREPRGRDPPGRFVIRKIRSSQVLEVS